MIFVILKSKNQSDESCLEGTSFFVLTKKEKRDEQLSPSLGQTMRPPSACSAKRAQEVGWELQCEQGLGGQFEQVSAERCFCTELMAR